MRDNPGKMGMVDMNEMLERMKTIAKQSVWGNWTFKPGNLVLSYDDPDTGIWYEVDLERCRNAGEVLDWIFQLLHKSWITAEDMICFLRALDNLLTPQANICPCGNNFTIDPASLLQSKIKVMKL